MWRATTKIWRGLSKFTIWRIVGGKDIGDTIPLQTGNKLFSEACGLALTNESIFKQITCLKSFTRFGTVEKLLAL